MATIPHFQFPMRIQTVQGQVQAVTVEQDSLADIQSCVRLIASCPIGGWALQPAFGIPDPLFGLAPINPAGIEQSLRAWEPRASLLIQEQGASLDDSVRNLQVSISSSQQDQ